LRSPRAALPRGGMVAAVLALAASCSKRTPSVIDARGPAEHGITSLWWLMLVLAVLVFVLVAVMLAGGVIRTKRRAPDAPLPDATWGGPFIAIVGVAITGTILIGVFVLSLRVLRADAQPVGRGALAVRVTGHDWWWEARYPNGAVTANEIHIPTGERVEIKLATVDVIHSFWVPQLGPKTDLIPGRVNSMWIEASTPGRYRGQCAEFCGFQHAHMVFYVVAQSPRSFASWERAEAAPLHPPASAEAARGEQIFLSSTCAQCHAVRGTTADADVGPDLTHLASRQTIAAGTLRNDAGDLSDWVRDPQSIKQGTLMPSAPLSQKDLDAVIAFLEGLR
jgi:cytochrome c oxidase subunit II